MRMRLARGVVMALSVVGLLGVTRSEAQVTTGTIVGTVKESRVRRSPAPP